MRLRRRPPAPDPWAPLLDLVYPSGLDADARERVRAVVGDGTPSLHGLRMALGALDQQVHPSPVTVRWSDGDVVHADVGGTRLVLDRADASVSVQILADGSYEPHVTSALERHLGPGDTFVDVGANVGYHTAVAARLVGPAGRVVAIEANPENARLLVHTAELNGLAQITVLPVALGPQWGSTPFGAHIGSNGGVLPSDTLTSGRATIVPTVPLDALGLDGVTLIKVDVEGAEALVLDGAEDLIRRQRPVIIAEFSVEMTRRVSGREPHDHLTRLAGWGYDIAVIDRTSHEPVAVASIDELLATWGDPGRIEDLLLTPN